MKRSFLSFLILLVFFSLHAQTYVIEGELKKWHKLSVVFDGPTTSELAVTNPFSDYRFDVTFTNGSSIYVVPGYYAADGNAAESSADSGNKWIVHFAPDKVGTWTFSTSFVSGIDVAINGGTGTIGILDNLSGTITITASDKSGKDLRGRGRLTYVGEHYLRFMEDSTWFYKAGADAPENTLAYEDFDEVPNVGGRRKNWQPHQQDYLAGDASSYTWQSGKGTELLGVVNYLSSKNVNALSFLTFNIDGDDDNVFPHLLKAGGVSTYQSYSDNTRWNQAVYKDRFDVSRMAQWERIFEYADKKGIYLHFKTQETENDNRMDGGDTGRERKLYYRELIARFSHHLALNWNTGEENTQTSQQEIDMAEYLYNTDPYKHNIVMHTYPGQYNRYGNLIGSQSEYTGASIQTSNPTYDELFGVVKTWVDNSKNASKKWIIAVDEPGNANIGIDIDPNAQKTVRSKVLWATLMAGGAGVEYYYGYQTNCTDLNCQNHRSRDAKYTDASYAIKFFDEYLQQYLPIVFNDNGLTTASDDYVLSNGVDAIAVYLPNGGSTNITLPQNSSWVVNWFNPRNGVFDSTLTLVTNVLTAPDASNDWVALLNTDCPPTGTACNDGNSTTYGDTINASCLCSGLPCIEAGTVCDDGNSQTYNDQEDGSCNCVGFAAYEIEGRVEAEDFYSQSGIQVQATTDTGGGSNIGFINNGDFAIYKINITATGLYKLKFRVASDTNGGSITYTIGSETEAVTISNTGGWQTWVDVVVQDSLYSGIVDFRLGFIGNSGSLMNVNYVDFTRINCINGTACNDSNPLTENDVLDASCNCAGTPILFSSPLLEAESGSQGSQWTLQYDDLACDSIYLLPPVGNNYTSASSNVNDHIIFQVNVSTAGIYKIYARVKTTNDGDDSFFVKVNNGSWQPWNKINYPYSNPNYQWSQVGNWTSGNFSTPVNFQFTAGMNEVYFSWREAGAKLDKIFITQDDLGILNQVRSTNSGAEYSMAYTIAESCPGDTIYFDPNLNGNVITLDEEITIKDPLVIFGNGPLNTIISAQLGNRLFYNNSQFSLMNLKLHNGNSGTNGGAFFNLGQLILENVDLEGNKEGSINKAFTNTGDLIIRNGGDGVNINN